MNEATDNPPTSGPHAGHRLPRGVGLALVAAVLAWAYAPTFAALVDRWTHEARYSHGYVVPAMAAAVWWVRRQTCPATGFHPRWWGLLFVLLGAALRLAGAYYYFDWFDGLSLLPVLLGLAVLAGGWPLLRQVGPSVAVLFFMLPLPFQIDGALSAPLQRLGTVVSTFALQTLGLPAVAEGNIILIDDLQIGVLEACNGLGMLSAFFALSTTVALLIRRPLLERIFVFLSAVPLGVLMNLVRVTATGLVYAAIGSAAAQAFFHDLAGWLMMPLALAALGLELYLLRRLFVPDRVTGGGWRVDEFLVDAPPRHPVARHPW